MQRRTSLQSIHRLWADAKTAPAIQARGLRLRPQQSTPLAVFRQWASDALYPQLKLNDDIEVRLAPARSNLTDCIKFYWRGHAFAITYRNHAIARHLKRGDPVRAHIGKLWQAPDSNGRAELVVWVEEGAN